MPESELGAHDELVRILAELAKLRARAAAKTEEMGLHSTVTVPAHRAIEPSIKALLIALGARPEDVKSCGHELRRLADKASELGVRVKSLQSREEVLERLALAYVSRIKLPEDDPELAESAARLAESVVEKVLETLDVRARFHGDILTRLQPFRPLQPSAHRPNPGSGTGHRWPATSRARRPRSVTTPWEREGPRAAGRNAPPNDRKLEY